MRRIDATLRVRLTFFHFPQDPLLEDNCECQLQAGSEPATTDDEVLDGTRTDLIERMSAGQWAVGWARGDDDRWPCFLEERQAVNWMRDRLSRGRVFA